MSTPSIKVGQGNWGIKAGNLLGYANTEKKFSPVEFTSTRALNTATRVNASGDIEAVNANVPRIDYFGGQASLLVEPSAKNFWLQSENLSSAFWLKLAGGAGVAPAVSSSTESLFGLPTFEVTFTPNGALSGDTSTIRQGFTPDATGNHTQSWYIRSLSGTQQLQAFFAGTSYQLTITETPTRVTATLNLNIITQWNCGLTQIGTHTRTNGKFLITAAQMEAGSVATSYIPTTTGSVTRNADVISVTGVAGLIGQTEGTIYAEVDIRNLTTADFPRIVSLRESANSNNFFEIEKRSSTQLRITARLNSGTTITFLTHPNAFQLGTNKIAFAYQDGNYAMGFNGVVATSSQAGMTASLNQVNLGSSSFNVAQLNDRISSVVIYPNRLTNAQLEYLTSFASYEEMASTLSYTLI